VKISQIHGGITASNYEPKIIIKSTKFNF